jgi:hypothetical protein
MILGGIITSHKQDGAAYYINQTDGDDSNNGSQTRPFKTLNKFFLTCNNDGYLRHTCCFQTAETYDTDYVAFVGGNYIFRKDAKTTLTGKPTIKFNSHVAFHQGYLTLEDVNMQLKSSTENKRFELLNSYLAVTNSTITSSTLKAYNSFISFYTVECPYLEFSGCKVNLTKITINNYRDGGASGPHYALKTSKGSTVVFDETSENYLQAPMLDKTNYTYLILCYGSTLIFSNTTQIKKPTGSQVWK